MYIIKWRLCNLCVLLWGHTFLNKSIDLLSSGCGRALSDIQLQFHGTAKVEDIFCFPNCAKDVKISQLRIARSTASYRRKTPYVFFEMAREDY